MDVGFGCSKNFRCSKNFLLQKNIGIVYQLFIKFCSKNNSGKLHKMLVVSVVTCSKKDFTVLTTPLYNVYQQVINNLTALPTVTPINLNTSSSAFLRSVNSSIMRCALEVSFGVTENCLLKSAAYSYLTMGRYAESFLSPFIFPKFS